MTEAATDAGTADDDVASDRVPTRTHRWHDPVVLADAVAGLSGLELFEKLASGELPLPPIADTLAFGRIEATGAGSVTLSLEPRGAEA